MNKFECLKNLYQAMQLIDECSGYANQSDDEALSELYDSAFESVVQAIAHFEQNHPEIEYDDWGNPIVE